MTITFAVDHRKNRSIMGEASERNFGPGGWRGNLNEPIFESNARGIGCRGGGMLKLRINRRTTCLLLSCFAAMIGQFLNDIKVFFNQRATYRHQFRVTESEKSSSH